MMLTPDEYMALMRLVTSERESEGASLAQRENSITSPKRRRTSQKVSQSRKKLSKALKEANAKLRKKNGDLKKGKTQADVMRMAHRLVKKNGTKKGMIRKTARRAYEKR
jgi:ElaB/YqjD/DUF883 family membrane-anchored ribosome-binding protein